MFLTGRRREKLAETVAEISAMGGRTVDCHLLPCDITDPQQVAAACATIRERCLSLQGLVNNAAVSQRRDVRWPLQEDTLEAWNHMLSMNLTAPWFLTRSVLPVMIHGGEVRILFVTSEAGWVPTPGFGPYTVSKAALNTLGASMATECAARYPETDVQINVLVPGEARTEMNAGSTESPYTIVSMALLLLSHPPGGPNGRFFHRDGRHLTFGHVPLFDRSLRDGRALA